ncbi:MAG: hypothetical protein DHS80DRAFT_21703 [Piptocephalis tieghemiana]|nr:MAG: hypothetical protein DHS80DRAFT_21703 [Piptocephalis tieghemiana]
MWRESACISTAARQLALPSPIHPRLSFTQPRLVNFLPFYPPLPFPSYIHVQQVKRSIFVFLRSRGIRLSSSSASVSSGSISSPKLALRVLSDSLVKDGSLSLYRGNPSRLRGILYIAAAVQSIFWVNLGTLAYEHLQEEDPDTKEKVKSSWGKRVSYLIGLSSLGLGLSAMMVLYASKHAHRLTFLADGRYLRVSYYPAPWSRSLAHRDLPVDRVFTRQRLLPPGIHDAPGSVKNPAATKNDRFFYIACKGNWISWVVDRSQGLWDPLGSRVWDALFLRPRGTPTTGLVQALTPSISDPATPATTSRSRGGSKLRKRPSKP